MKIKYCIIILLGFLLLSSLSCSERTDIEDVQTSLLLTKGKDDNKVYYLRSKSGYNQYGLILNGRREMPENTYEIGLDDTITLERPEEPQTQWYVNDQYITTGNIITFTARKYAYSANNDEFLISYK